MIRLPILFLVFSWFQLSAQRKDHQLGLRIGEPMGITYKYFIKESAALEFIFGTAGVEWNSRYYANAFDSYDQFRYDTYVNHKIRDIYYFQARYLIEKPVNIEALPGNLDWYWGVGALSKRARIDYFYRDFDLPIAPTSSRVIDYDLGIESIIGVDYTFQEIPLTMFLELSVLVELYNRVGSFRGFSGIGLRYNF